MTRKRPANSNPKTTKTTKTTKRRKVNKPKEEQTGEYLWKPINDTIPDAISDTISDTISDAIQNTEKKPINEWVSATALRNYLLNDPLLDWLNLYYTKCGLNNNKDQNSNDQNSMNLKNRTNNRITKEVKIGNKNKMMPLFENGLLFETEVINDLKNKFPDSIQIGYTKNDLNEDKYNETLQCMKRGVPFIFQAIMFNNQNKTMGMADLLVRSDYINKIFEENQLDNNEINIKAKKLDHDYHYRVMDIKWTTMHLCANGKLIRNSDNFPAYKGQMAIYNCALGHMQGYYPEKAYILGKSWKYEVCKTNFKGFSCFDLLGHIDYSDFDKPFIEKTTEAIKWIRSLRQNGEKWTLVPPSVPQLYPNMSNTNDAPWSEVKQIISEKNHELTNLWMVGPKNRRIGHKNGIFKWSDLNCRADKLGIYGEKIGPIVNKIIDINNSTTEIINPNIIKNNFMGWQNETKYDFYIDFETVNGCFMEPPNNIYNSRSATNIIFLIGVWYFENNINVENNTWNYKSFKIENLNDIKNEEKIIDEWKSFIESRCPNGNPRFFHWSNAEKTSINIANCRHDYKWSEWLKNIVWIDLCKIFQNEPIVIKGAFKFKLKEIAKSMYNHKMINTIWKDNEINDGLSAMIDAINYYKKKIKDPENIHKDSTLNEIEKYNKIDCKVIWEITDYLRQNHTEIIK